MKNEKGFVLILVLGILSVLTIIGTVSVMISNTELQIAGNEYAYYKNFYAADSHGAIGVTWLESDDEDGNPNLPESEYKNVDWYHEINMPIGNINQVDVLITHWTDIDPSDGIEKVLLYGDENGDYMNEINFTVGKPLAKITGTGTFRIKGPRAGGRSVLESGWIWEPLFIDPNAALRVKSNVNGNGVSGSIIGEHKAGSSCGDVTDIMYDIWGGVIEYGGNLGAIPRIEPSGGIYPMSLIEPIMKKKATLIMEGSMNIDESKIVTSEENLGVVYIDGNGKTTNLVGYGVLFVNGNFEFAGNLDWNGLILVYGDLVFSGGGTKTIDGAVVAFGDAVALNGSVDIQYDCDLLKKLNDLYSGYKKVYWRDI